MNGFIGHIYLQSDGRLQTFAVVQLILVYYYWLGITKEESRETATNVYFDNIATYTL